ncbi:MAG TPA: alpha/beta fold hydrolase [Chlorobaculum sp.]|nr:alpha/beta fold hydrolase [Chlorobaculum sp.]
MRLEVITQKPSSVTRSAPILFVHGMWHAAWCWEEHFMPFFSQKGFETFALSLRGHGGSDGRNQLRRASLDDYVSDVVEVVGRFGLPPIVVGHSMGGMIVQKYLESYPAAAAVLMASVPPGGIIPATMRIFLRHPLQVLKANLTLSLLPVVSTPQLVREMFFSPDIADEMVSECFVRLQDESYRVYLDMLGLNLPKLNGIDAPLLVLGAENDRIITVKEVMATARRYGVEAEIFSGMAHNMILEHDWQKVADRILIWLDRQGF